MTLLRQYETWECLGDGYPQAWHRGVDVEAYFGGATMAPADPGIKDLIREQADYRCLRCGHPYPPGIAKTYPRGEWTPCDERCTHTGQVRMDGRDEVRIYFPPSELWIAWESDGQPRREIAAHWRILTVHHLDEDKANCRWWNLVALCQRCHLRMQRAVVMDRTYHFEHSGWFKPYAAGFYAWKYLGEDLTREQTMERLDELLALEHRFTQEALL